MRIKTRNEAHSFSSFETTLELVIAEFIHMWVKCGRVASWLQRSQGSQYISRCVILENAGLEKEWASRTGKSPENFFTGW